MTMTHSSQACSTRMKARPWTSSVSSITSSRVSARLELLSPNGTGRSTGETIEMSEITTVTRKNIIDELSLGFSWSGSLDEVEFLSRLYNLSALPSHDYRYNDASGDIWKHRVINSDWSDNWVFSDSRLDLSSDEEFLNFLCETIHPIVRSKEDDVATLLKIYNKYLATDGWEIVETSRISGKAVFGARRGLLGHAASVEAAKEMAVRLNAEYLAQQITRMESAIDNDPELAIGTAKEFIETISKLILEERNVPYGKNADLPGLVKLTVKRLKVVPDSVQNQRNAEDIIKRLLNNLASMGRSLAELRNLHGTGHGKNATYQGLQEHHGRLAVRVAMAIGVFLFEAHQKTP